MEHSPGFLKLVNEARPYVHEVNLQEARERLKSNPAAVLVDVREDEEWRRSCERCGASGKGVLERDIEKLFPDVSRELIMYCGGGYRSVLTAWVAQKMGYRNVHSLVGRYKALVQANYPMETSEPGV